MAEAITRRERRRITKEYYRKCRKGWLDRIRGRLRRSRDGGDAE